MDKTIFDSFRYVQFIDGNMDFSLEEFVAIDKQTYELVNTRHRTPMPQDEYELIQDGNGNRFLGIKDIFKAYVYELVIDDETFHVSTQYLKNVIDLLDRDADQEKGEFTFTKSEFVYDPKTNRCDESMKGPSVFLRPGEQPISRVFNSNVIGTMSDLLKYVPILTVDGVGHIIYVELVDPSRENFDTNANTMPKATRTISELLKLMLEWKQLKDPPWNGEDEISSAVERFFEELRMPEEIRQHINDNQGDMQIARFIKGEKQSRRRPPKESIQPITPVIRRWILSNIFFPNYDTLKRELNVNVI